MFCLLPHVFIIQGGPKVCILDKQTLSSGRYDMRPALSVIADCHENKVFPLVKCIWWYV